MIRYHRSLNHKLCRLGIGGCFLTPSAPYEKSKSLGSGGSMVARLKLKEIDLNGFNMESDFTFRLDKNDKMHFFEELNVYF